MQHLFLPARRLAALAATILTFGCAAPAADPAAPAESQVVSQCVTGSSICRRSAGSGPSGVVSVSGDTIRANGGVMFPDKGVTAPGDGGN